MFLIVGLRRLAKPLINRSLANQADTIFDLHHADMLALVQKLRTPSHDELVILRTIIQITEDVISGRHVFSGDTAFQFKLYGMALNADRNGFGNLIPGIQRGFKFTNVAELGEADKDFD